MADEHLKESISALVDGELSATEMQSVIRQVRASDEERRCWHNYNLIGDALRNNLPPAMDHRFAERVSAAIASEPPLQVTPSIPSPAKSVRKKSNYSRQAAGFAVAASVAVIGFVGFSMISAEDQSGTAAPQVASITPSQVMPVAAQNHYQQVHGLQWTAQQPAIQSRLNAYLQNHQQLSGTMVINGRMVPRAQFAVETQSYNQ